MDRREFLATAAAVGSLALDFRQLRADQHGDDRTFATPEAAGKSPPEKLGYVIGVYAGTEVKKPDYLATIDLDPASKTYSQVIHRLPMPNVGDELHHWSSFSGGVAADSSDTGGSGGGSGFLSSPSSGRPRN